MKVLPEYHDATQFLMPNYQSHFVIKRPYTTFAKSMSLKFEDYYVIYSLIWIGKFETSMRRVWQNMGNLP